MPVNKAWMIDAFRIAGHEWPTTVGDRVVSAAGAVASVQRATGHPPFSTDFDGWLDMSAVPGAELNRTDVAANGSVAALELVAWSGGTRTDGEIAMLPVSGLGGDLEPGDCFLPVQGVAGEASLSQDGKHVAWHDARGVVVAGAPDFAGSDPCTLTTPPVVISATGTQPSLGGTALPAQQPQPPRATDPEPEPQAPVQPGLALSGQVKASALRKGVALEVTVGAATLVKATGKVRGRTVAKGSKRAAGAGTVTVRLKATKKAAKRLRKLRGRTLRIKVTAGGASASMTRKLR